MTKDDAGFSLGALFWQYFEDLDQITVAETPLRISKKLFVKTNSERREIIKPIGDNVMVEVGDLLRVRIEIEVDREMDFVHLKDMRAAGLEPVNVLSSYNYQDGLGYYQSTRDAATHFYFEHLAQGVYIFEYDLRASHAGYFSNGITTIQSIYAPEFNSYSEGSRLDVK